MQGIITKLEHFTTYDGYGIRSTLFLKGCPLRCKWCANPETQQPYPEIYFIAEKCRECGQCVQVCPEAAVTMDKERKIDRARCTRCLKCVELCPSGALARVGTETSSEKVAAEMARDIPFYKRSKGGITLSGGEPLFQPEFTADILRLCQAKGIHTCLDTCGYAPADKLEPVLRHTDLILLDLKSMDPAVHREWTGVSNELILENARIMAASCEVRVSLPLIGGVNDSDSNIEQTADFAASLGIKYVDVLPFHRLGESKYRYLGLVPCNGNLEVSEERIARVLDIIKSRGLTATRGRGM